MCRSLAVMRGLSSCSGSTALAAGMLPKAGGGLLRGGEGRGGGRVTMGEELTCKVNAFQLTWNISAKEETDK